ncbi:hypothetical protein CHS0354_023022 [Potamilus streckersoni]|uniref:TLDc domain-containing protein n=1 Tax=Potamilus streckersoni TaxID=2493646 RepID=A0AAE0VL18_9BIVA|nr:hypothetical protein CHS0354_023022 [Potamilus streckersoni]
MAKKITKNEKKQLETWIGQGPKTFQLLYSSERDGCSAITFHQRCDNQGSTVTVVYNTNNSVYGGFTKQSWKSTGGWVSDDCAFLFQLRLSGIEQCNKFPVVLAYIGSAIYGHSNYGPTFGGGHTLHLFSGTISKSGSSFALNGNANFADGYYTCSVSQNNITNGHMNVFDIEVYKVIDGADPADNDKPWRKAPPFTKERAVFHKALQVYEKEN